MFPIDHDFRRYATAQATAKRVATQVAQQVEPGMTEADAYELAGESFHREGSTFVVAVNALMLKRTQLQGMNRKPAAGTATLEELQRETFGYFLRDTCASLKT